MSVESKIAVSGTNLPTIQRFDAGDYKETPVWFSQKFLSALNLFLQPAYNILNKNVSVMQNTTDELYSFTITAGAAAANNTFTFTPKKFVGIPSGVVLGQCLALVNNVPTGIAIGGAVTLDWFFSGSTVKILAIYGLTNGSIYKISLRIF